MTSPFQQRVQPVVFSFFGVDFEMWKSVLTAAQVLKKNIESRDMMFKPHMKRLSLASNAPSTNVFYQQAVRMLSLCLATVGVLAIQRM